MPLPSKLPLPVAYLVTLPLVEGVGHKLKIVEAVVQLRANTPWNDVIDRRQLSSVWTFRDGGGLPTSELVHTVFIETAKAL